MTSPDQMPLSNSDWIAMSSAVIAVCAFFATAWQAWLTRKHNRLTVTPRITSSTDTTINDNHIEIKLTVRNVGVGPALVEGRYFTIDGEKFSANGQELVPAICSTVFGTAFRYRIAQDGMIGGKGIIPAGSEIVIAKLIFPDLGPQAKPAVFGAASRANFVVKYKCLYGRRFTFSTAN